MTTLEEITRSYAKSAQKPKTSDEFIGWADRVSSKLLELEEWREAGARMGWDDPADLSHWINNNPSVLEDVD